MSITMPDGRTYTYLSDGLMVNGRRVTEARVDGALVYPRDEWPYWVRGTYKLRSRTVTYEGDEHGPDGFWTDPMRAEASFELRSRLPLYVETARAAGGMEYPVIHATHAVIQSPIGYTAPAIDLTLTAESEYDVAHLGYPPQGGTIRLFHERVSRPRETSSVLTRDYDFQAFGVGIYGVGTPAGAMGLTQAPELTRKYSLGNATHYTYVVSLGFDRGTGGPSMRIRSTLEPLHPSGDMHLRRARDSSLGTYGLGCTWSGETVSYMSTYIPGLTIAQMIEADPWITRGWLRTRWDCELSIDHSPSPWGSLQEWAEESHRRADEISRRLAGLP